MEKVIGLAQAKNVSLAGGKGAALARLLQAGFKVPGGFVVTTAAKTVNPSLTDEVLAAFDRLGAQYVAVRSSAVAEDGAKDAWAGQLDTYLNVTKKDLMDKIQLCWASAGSTRAKSYASQKGLKAGGVAVVVQAMIQGDTSGIAFSANPVTNDSSQVVIEAGFGLNEPIVSGEITPDTYVINKSPFKIIQKSISNQEKQFIKGKNGQNQWQKVENGDEQKVSDSQIKEITETVVKLEQYFGYPIDSEWTFLGNKLYVLQARPITTLA